MYGGLWITKISLKKKPQGFAHSFMDITDFTTLLIHQLISARHGVASLFGGNPSCPFSGMQTHSRIPESGINVTLIWSENKTQWLITESPGISTTTVSGSPTHSPPRNLPTNVDGSPHRDLGRLEYLNVRARLGLLQNRGKKKKKREISSISNYITQVDLGHIADQIIT